VEIIDSHQHFWKVGLFDYPWMSADLGVLYRDYLPGTLAPILRRNGVAGTVLVQASNSLRESRWLMSLADRTEFIKGVVGWVDLADPSVGQQINELAANPKFKGVRHLVESETDDGWLVQASVLAGLKTLAANRLSYDLLVHTRHLPYARTVAETCPDLMLVVDHMAKPSIATHAISQWAGELKQLASFPNVHCKLSGLVTEANHASWNTDDLRPFVECAVELFGPERLMFGSDYPVCLLAATYDRVLESFQELLKDLDEDERSRIFSGNARKFYKLGSQGEVVAAST